MDKHKIINNMENEIRSYLNERIKNLKERVVASHNSMEILCLNDTIEELKSIKAYFL